jgi:nitric-oxide synthase
MPGEEAKIFPIPQEDVLIVQIKHPTYEWFEDLNLQWVSVPFVSSINYEGRGLRKQTFILITIKVLALRVEE